MCTKLRHQAMLPARRRLKERADMLQSMVDSQVEAEGWEAPPEAVLDRSTLHAALQACRSCGHGRLGW